MCVCVCGKAGVNTDAVVLSNSPASLNTNKFAAYKSIQMVPGFEKQKQPTERGLIYYTQKVQRERERERERERARERERERGRVMEEAGGGRRESVLCDRSLI